MRTRLTIYSHRMQMKYVVQRFSEYKIDIDLETDADGFNMVFENPDGVYTGYFNKFDIVDLTINGVGVLRGWIDNVRYRSNESQNLIQVVGRDIASIFVDNDAIPTTRYNVRPSQYIADKCNEYGIVNYVIDQSIPVTSKLIIGTGESEISIMNNLLIGDGVSRRIWTIYDTLYAGKWAMDAKPSYTFVRGTPRNTSGIPIQSLDFMDDGTEMHSEVMIYGSIDDGNEKIVGSGKNSYLIGRGIKKRKVMRSYNNDSSSKYASNALREVRDSCQFGMILEITTKVPDDMVVMPNKTAHVIDTNTQINSIFFIKSVTYTKNIGSGSIMSVSMIPGEESFDVIWNNQGNKAKGNIVGITRSLSELLGSRK